MAEVEGIATVEPCNRTHVRIWLFTLLLCFSLFGQAAIISPAEIRFERLAVEEGLSHAFVRSLLQDRRGFIWIGTQSGLNRYDGYDFKVFRPDPRDPRSLSNAQVTDLLETRNGDLWVATAGGLNRFDPETQTFEYFLANPDVLTAISSNQVFALAEDLTGGIWIATPSGLNRLDPETGEFTVYYNNPHITGSLSDDTVTDVLVDSRGMLWVATNGGLNRLDPQTGRFVIYRHDPEDETSLPSNRLTTLFEDSLGMLWVGGYNGLSRFQPQDQTFERFSNDPEAPSWIAPNISDIAEDSRGNLWITTFQGVRFSGLFFYDREHLTFTRIANEPGDSRSLSWNYATAVFVDPRDVLWVGTSRGLNRMDLNSDKFQTFRTDSEAFASFSDNIYGLFIDRQNQAWMGLDLPGFVKLNLETGEYRLFSNEEAGFVYQAEGGVYGIHIDRQDRVWLTTVGGGLALFGEDRVERFFRHDPRDPNSISSDFLTVICEPREGGLWIGGDSGLNYFDPDTERFRHFQHSLSDPRSLSSNMIISIYQDQSGVLWVGTGPYARDAYVAGASGLNRYHAETADFTVYAADPRRTNSLSDNTVSAMLEDSNGRFWVGTGNGLNLMHRDQGVFEVFSEAEGLVGSEIRGVLEGEDGMIWISTNRGLSVLNPETFVFRNYGADEGTQAGRYNQYAYFKDHQGRLFFGGSQGMDMVTPEPLEIDPNPPSVVITEVSLLNQPLSIDVEGPLTTAPERLSRLVLPYDQNHVGFVFAALHFSNPDKNQYQYYLQGFEDEWRRPVNERRVNYTNLDPGSYTLRVRAANPDGVWMEDETRLKVVILPPWWRTWWAYAVYLSMLIGSVYGFTMIQIRRSRLRIAIQAQKEQQTARLREADLARIAAEAQSRAIEADNRRKTDELERARLLQLSMLPDQVPDHAELHIAAVSEPATEVGGDYYDFFVAEETGLIGAVGDATGHGLQAGAMVAATKALFNATAHADRLDASMAQISKALKAMKLPRMYMGLCLFHYQKSALSITAGGMPFPLLYRYETGQVEELPLRGFPLGSIAVEFPVHQLQLRPGDTLLLMSDGLIERFNAERELLGVTRVSEVFASIARDRAEAIVENLMALGRRWAGDHPKDDDITLVVIQRRLSSDGR